MALLRPLLLLFQERQSFDEPLQGAAATTLDEHPAGPDEQLAQVRELAR